MPGEADYQLFDLDDIAAIDTGELQQPWDDNPDLAGREVDTARHLAGDRRFTRTPTARTFTDFRANPDAYKHVGALPRAGETHHMVIGGTYAMWDLVPAALDLLAPATIAHLQLATLSFSDRNAAELLALMDAKKIGRVSLLISHYFKHTSRHLYDQLIPQLLERGQRVLAMRTHAKIILIEATDGRKYALSGSPNLRSCKNVEALDFTADAALHDFYAGVMQELLRESAK